MMKQTKDMSDVGLIRALVFLERLYTPQGLQRHAIYKALLREAAYRSLRTENLTEAEVMVRIETEGPGLDRPG